MCMCKDFLNMCIFFYEESLARIKGSTGTSNNITKRVAHVLREKYHGDPVLQIEKFPQFLGVKVAAGFVRVCSLSKNMKS